MNSKEWLYDQLTTVLPDVGSAMALAKSLTEPLDCLIESRVSERTKELREALQFYANMASASEAKRLFVQDGGQRARTILKKSDPNPPARALESE